jgi:putative transposase
MKGILSVLKTECQWKALDATGICSGSTAHRRFQEWVKAGVFERFCQQGLLAYDELKGIDWKWMSADGSMQKAPLSKTKKIGPNPTDRGKQGVKRSLLCDAKGIPPSVEIDGANRHDVKLLELTLESLQIERPPKRERESLSG